MTQLWPNCDLTVTRLRLGRKVGATWRYRAAHCRGTLLALSPWGLRARSSGACHALRWLEEKIIFSSSRNWPAEKRARSITIRRRAFKKKNNGDLSNETYYSTSSTLSQALHNLSQSIILGCVCTVLVFNHRPNALIYDRASLMCSNRFTNVGIALEPLVLLTVGSQLGHS